MEQPIQLVDVTPGGKLRLNPPALQQLRNVGRPACVIGIIGKYRDGKSYLLNRIFACKPGEGFDLGHSVKGETKGIWLWYRLVGDAYVVLLDCEGTGDVDRRDSELDVKLAILVTLLTSYLIVNLKGALDETTLSQLQYEIFIVRAADGIGWWRNSRKI